MRKFVVAFALGLVALGLSVGSVLASNIGPTP
jgi:hypothetical protein